MPATLSGRRSTNDLNNRAGGKVPQFTKVTPGRAAGSGGKGGLLVRKGASWTNTEDKAAEACFSIKGSSWEQATSGNSWQHETTQSSLVWTMHHRCIKALYMKQWYSSMM
jgi:hypothetical protein